MKLQRKLLLAMMPVFLVAFAVHAAFSYRSVQQSVLDDLRREARNMRAVLMATRNVYHHQFINSGLEVNEKTVGFLPAHALSRISKEFKNWTNDGLRFNNVSDRARNPDNAADESELEAMAFFRANPELEERFVPITSSDGQELYHYTRPIWIEQYCLKCHGSRDDAPPSIRNRYVSSYDYKLGDLRGVMSIKLPSGIAEKRSMATAIQILSFNLAGYAAAFVAVYFLLFRYILRHLKRLEQGGIRLAGGDYAWRSGIGGGDELASVAASFDQMAERIGEREDALRKSEERHRSLVDNIPGAVYRHRNDQQRTLEFIGEEVESLSGRPAADFVGERGCGLAAIVHPDDRVQVHNAVQEALRNDKPYVLGYRVLHADKTVRWVSDRGRGLEGRDGEEPYLDGVLFDITAHKHAEEEAEQLEARLHQSQKMEAIGQLAGGVAHDFNNILTAILGNVDMARTGIENDVHADRELDSELGEIERGALRAAELTKQLLAFSRQQVIRPEVLDLNEVVGEMEKMLQRLLTEDIAMTFVPCPDLPPVLADMGKVQQVAMNLVLNARDAMPSGGTLTLETTRASLDKAFVAAHPESEVGEYVLLTVSDAGTGMDAETLRHIFEPFFTTKPAGQGTGLGLATVYGIVKQTGGYIDVISTPGHGTVVHVYLPVATTQEAEPVTVGASAV